MFVILGVVASGALPALSAHPRSGLAVALAAIAIVVASAALPYGLARIVSPAPNGVRWVHLAAGCTAAWLAMGVATIAERAGLAGTSTGFRVLWAPLAEETLKALMLAAAVEFGDERCDRAQIVTRSVAVAVGFAIRENYVYFHQALSSPPIYLEWVILRAAPPVLAHASFGMVMGGAMAHDALHARAEGRAEPRISVMGLVLAGAAHVAFNGVALLVLRYAQSYVFEITLLWSLVAIGAAWMLRQRVLTLATEDEAADFTLVPPRDNRERDTAIVCAVVLLAMAIPWIPIQAASLVLAPGAIAFGLAIAVGRMLHVRGIFVALITGVALRPVTRTFEWVVSVLSSRWGHGRWLRWGSESLGLSATFVLAALIVHGVRQTRSASTRCALSIAIVAGIVGSGLSGALASLSPAVPLAGAALDGALPMLPVALLVAGCVGIGLRRHVASALAAGLAAGCAAATLDTLAHMWTARGGARIELKLALAALALLLLAGIVAAVRRSRLAATLASVQPTDPPHSTPV